MNIGDKAYNFQLLDKDGKTVQLSDFLGKKVVLYFYPKDNTPGCTREAQDFKRLFDEFAGNNTVVIGISKDSVQSHVNFATKYDLPFVLLSDPDLVAIKAYDVWQQKTMCGRTSMGVVRTTFVIDEHGIVVNKYDKVKVDGHADKVLQCVCSL